MQLQGSCRKKNWRCPPLKRQLKDVMEKEKKLKVQLRQLRAQFDQIQITYANVIHYPENTLLPHANTLSHTHADSRTACDIAEY